MQILYLKPCFIIQVYVLILRCLFQKNYNGNRDLHIQLWIMEIVCGWSIELPEPENFNSILLPMKSCIIYIIDAQNGYASLKAFLMWDKA